VAQKPRAVAHAVERRVPLHCFAHAGNRANDELVHALCDLAFPARDRGDVCPHGRIALALRDLRVVAREKHRLTGLARRRLLPLRRRLLLARGHLFASSLNAAAARISALNARSSSSSPSW